MGSPKRLIEVDFPIRKISEHARKEKEMRRSHVPLLYIWPATRPTSVCRAVICGSLWPDPADPNCPKDFRKKAVEVIRQVKGGNFEDPLKLRKALLDFIADFSAWEMSTNQVYLNIARELVSAAHIALGGEPGTRPLIVDPFAGGGAIPLEGLRVGAEVFSGDLNSVAAFYNKILLESLPKHGTKLIEEIVKWYKWIKIEVDKELREFYPESEDGSIPIVYLWARTIKCEGPSCGVNIPLIRSLRLTRNKNRSVGLKIITNPNKKRVEFKIIHDSREINIGEGTIKRGSAICPFCGYTTPISSVRKQLDTRKGGINDARMFCVVTVKKNSKGRFYRLPTNTDLEAFEKAKRKLEKLQRDFPNLVPDESLPIPPEGKSGTLGIGLQGYGIKAWRDLFNFRQLLAHTTYIKLSREYLESLADESQDFRNALASIICLVINRLIDLNASLCVWQLNTPNTAHVFGRWALSMVTDYGEVNPLAGAGGSIDSVIKRVLSGIKNLINGIHNSGVAHKISAPNVPLPNNSVNYFITDPPYYDAVPYSDLSDFFYVWMKRLVGDRFVDLFENPLTNKDDECIMDNNKGKSRSYFEKQMEKAMSEGRRILDLDGLGVIIFAHKSTSGWEALLQAILNSGWAVTASWPIDTEMQSRLRAKNSATLSSSIHLVCRPRPQNAGVGDWREVLSELRPRIHEWMPRLSNEGIVGADAIFSCLGPALEIFSRYDKVETASGKKVELKEYLEHVWAAVAREALNMVFEGADASGFEEDSRLTAFWLWTLHSGQNQLSVDSKQLSEKNKPDTDHSLLTTKKLKGFFLEYDAARKIAQGLGAHLEVLGRPGGIVEIKGDKARLVSVEERGKYLFKRDGIGYSDRKGRRKIDPQQEFGFVEGMEVEVEREKKLQMRLEAPERGKTILDRLHQAMLLFADGRSETLRRFIVDKGVGYDDRFWRLADVLNYLYPRNSEEWRWINGVLGKKKNFGY